MTLLHALKYEEVYSKLRRLTEQVRFVLAERVLTKIKSFKKNKKIQEKT